MRKQFQLLLDENLGRWVYERLREMGYSVQSVLLEMRGATDEQVVRRAIEHGKIIVTMDKDFGYLARSYKPPELTLLRLNTPNAREQVKSYTTSSKTRRKALQLHNRSNRHI